MANTGVVWGGDILLYKNTGTDAAPEWEAFAHATSHSYSGSTNIREQGDKDDGGDTRIKPGRHGLATISISGLKSYDGTDANELESMRQAREKLHFKLSGRPAADEDFIDTVEAAGDKYKEGYGYISEYSEEQPFDGDVTYSATITCDGQPELKSVGA